jgi:hypothetical protein
VTEARFWALIEEHVDVGEDLETDTSRLQDALEGLPPEEILSFSDLLTRLFCASYSLPLWGAAYLIGGGCSDDGFEYFRGWLIAQGRTVFEAAMRDPDSLADHSAESVECEDMLHVADRAYEATTGREMEGRSYTYPDLDDGWDFDDDTEMKRRYPRLYARYCEGAGPTSG